MRRLITISFLLFIALCGWANGTVSAKDSICIIEGTVKNLPDGCDIILYGTAGKYSGKQRTVTQIRKGKFRFEKKVKGDERYCLFLYPCVESLDLYVSPGTKANITGNDAHPSVWNVKSDNPMQQEWNAYQKTEMDSLAEYTAIRLRINEIDARLSVINTDNEKEKLLTEKNKLAEKFSGLCSEYVKSMYNFMKDRAYSDIFSDKLRYMADKVIENTLDDTYSDIIVELLQKIPKEDLQDYNIVHIKRIMGMKKDPYPTEIHKSTSRAISTSAKDAGWCTFYDAEKSYETDGHTDIYIIRTTDKDGIIELSDKTERIIPAGCPVILHLNNVMEDGTHRAILTEARETDDYTKSTKSNLLDLTSTGETIINAWRIGFSAEDNKVALYPWETDKAEGGIVYFRKSNGYIKDSRLDMVKADTKWDIDIKMPIGNTQWHTRDLKKMPFTKDTNIHYFENAAMATDDVKVIGLIGQPIKIAEGNEMIYPRFFKGDTFIEDKLWNGKKSYHLCHFGKDGWGVPKTDLHNNSYVYLRFVKGKDNSVLYTDGGCPIGLRSLTLIPDASSFDNIANSANYQEYDLSEMEDFMLWGERFYQLSDSTILVVGASQEDTEHLFSILNYKNQTFKPLNYFPNDGLEQKPLIKLTVYGYCSDIFGNGKGHYLFVCDRERYAFIFSIEGDSVNVIKDLYSTYSNYETGDGYNPIKHIVRTEGLYCETTNDNICFLLTDKDKFGKKIKIEDYSRQYLYGNTIEIYDWDGKQQKKVIKLDHIGQRIFISDDNKTLYLLTDDYWEGDPNPQIWAYDISNLDSLTSTDLSTETYEFADFSSQNIVKNPTKVVEEGDMMADFELYDYDDKPHHLNEFVGTGKYTILEFSGLGCGPCHAAKPFLEKFYKDNKDRFEMITISNDNEKLWKKKPLGEVSWHEWNDHNSAYEITRKYGVIAIPYFIIINPNGKIEKKVRTLAAFFEAMEEYIPAEKLKEYMKKME